MPTPRSLVEKRLAPKLETSRRVRAITEIQVTGIGLEALCEHAFVQKKTKAGARWLASLEPADGPIVLRRITLAAHAGISAGFRPPRPSSSARIRGLGSPREALPPPSLLLPLLPRSQPR